MKFNLSSIEIRGYSDRKFSTLQTRAVRDVLWSKLTGRNTDMARFPEGIFQKGLNRRLLGVMDIPIEKIIGTLYRHTDFDHQFRPLRKKLRDRWVNIYLLREGDGWPPIRVHKVGDYYYVEDGHHRVSVARALGLSLIQAHVTDYPSHGPSTPCRETKCREKTLMRKYVVATE